MPAWVCDAPQCRYREIVRQTKVSATAESRQAIAASKDVQAAAPTDDHEVRRSDRPGAEADRQEREDHQAEVSIQPRVRISETHRFRLATA